MNNDGSLVVLIILLILFIVTFFVGFGIGSTSGKQIALQEISLGKYTAITNVVTNVTYKANYK